MRGYDFVQKELDGGLKSEIILQIDAEDLKNKGFDWIVADQAVGVLLNRATVLHSFTNGLSFTTFFITKSLRFIKVEWCGSCGLTVTEYFSTKDDDSR